MPANLYTVSAAEIEAWPKGNYDDPVQRTWLVPFAVVFQVISTVFVFGRLYLRVRARSGPFGVDDVFIFIGWAFSVAFTASAWVGVYHYDIGRHVWDIHPYNYPNAYYNAWVAQVLFLFSTGATKVSVLLFYRRMLNNLYSRAWHWAAWILLFLTASIWISIFLACCFICRPLSTYWNILKMLTLESYSECINGDALTISTSVLTIASDFWTAALPCAMFQYLDLGLTKRQKYALNVIFCLGFLVTGCSIARTYYLWKIGHDMDLSWVGYDLFVAGVLEVHIAIICTCAPFLRAFFRRYFPALTNRSGGGSRTGRSNGGTASDSANRTTVRGSFNGRPLPPPPPIPMKSDSKSEPLTRNHQPLGSSGEKTGFLVREEGTGRLVWSTKGSRMSNLLSKGPMEYV